MPCMRETPMQNTFFPCVDRPFTTTIDNPCTLVELCGLGGFARTAPDQWYRFITPIFLHGGVVHLLFNLLAQLMIGYPLERRIGAPRLAGIYMFAGIGGNVFGANVAPISRRTSSHLPHHSDPFSTTP